MGVVAAVKLGGEEIQLSTMNPNSTWISPAKFFLVKQEKPTEGYQIPAYHFFACILCLEVFKGESKHFEVSKFVWY